MGHRIRHHARFSLAPAALVLLLQVPSLRAVAKYVPWSGPAAVVVSSLVVLVGWAVMYGGIWRRLPSAATSSGAGEPITGGSTSDQPCRLPGWLRSPVLAAVLITLIAAVAWIVYPTADARRATGQGSTGDDALREPVCAMIDGRWMYDATLYDGSPISPGPGWIVLNAPFTLLGVYPLLTPFYLAVTVFVCCRWSGEPAAANLLLILLASGLIFWELLVTGHDLIALGCAALIALVAAERAVAEPGPGRLTGVAVLAGFVATSRFVLLPLPGLLALVLWRTDRTRAMLLALTATAVALVLHVVGWLFSDSYPPLHLFTRGGTRTGIDLIIVGLIATAVCAAWGVPRGARRRADLLAWYAACLVVPLAFVALGEWRSVGFRPADWEGANYLMPATPAAIFALVYRRLG